MTTEKKPPRVVVACRFAQSGIDAMDAAAEELGIDRSEFIRQACAEKLIRHRDRRTT